mgnify:FL=1
MSHPKYLIKDSNLIHSMPSVFILVMAILSLPFIPGVGVGFFYAKSLSLGLFSFCLIYSFYFVRFLPSLQFLPRSLCVSILLLILYSVIQLVYFKEFAVKQLVSMEFALKPLVSAPILFFIFITSCLSAVAFSKMNNDALYKAILAVFKILILVAIFNIIFQVNFLNYIHYPSLFPFTEPSQFAQFFGTIATISFVLQKTLALRILIGSLVFCVALAIPSVTLMVYAFLLFILTIKARLADIILSILLIALTIYTVISIPYFTDRLIISQSSDNLSALVYLQGITDVIYSLKSTSYLGLGFQSLGTQPPSEISAIIEEIAGAQLNREDGGFLAAKILSEFGVLGAIFIIYYMRIGFKAFLFLRKQNSVSNIRRDLKALVVAAIIFAFSVEIFVRGAGYFSPGVFLFLFSLFYFKKYMKSSFSSPSQSA